MQTKTQKQFLSTVFVLVIHSFERLAGLVCKERKQWWTCSTLIWQSIKKKLYVKKLKDENFLNENVDANTSLGLQSSQNWVRNWSNTDKAPESRCNSDTQHDL